METHLFFSRPWQPLAVRIATRREEWLAAYELVYRCYLARGYLRPHVGGIVYREEFALSTSRTLVAVAPDCGKGVVGTLTLVGDHPAGLDIERTYPVEVQELRERGRRIAEVTCLATRGDEGFGPREVFYRLTQFMIQYSYWRQYDNLLLAVHPRHHRFYWHCFRVWPLGPCRTYHSVNGNPAICCRIDLNHLRRNVSPAMWQKYFQDELPAGEYQRPGIGPLDHAWLSQRCGIAPIEEKGGLRGLVAWDGEGDNRARGRQRS